MTMSAKDLTAYRASAKEQLRTADLLRMMPLRGRRALDVGARDGYFSRLMADRFDEVVALDLERPPFEIPGVQCVAGDATQLQFNDGEFDFVFCAEVLEHVPTAGLAKACQELARVCRGSLLIGVPDRQDLRVGRTTCSHCGRPNPPWGHVNRFDDATLRTLFAGCEVKEISRVGATDEATNDLAAWLMDVAGNPYGTYDQEEPCVHCGNSLGGPAARSLVQKLATKLAFFAQRMTPRLPRANWIHVLLVSGTSR